MKTTMMLAGLLAAVSLCAADASRILLRGATINVEEGKAAGSARAIVGDMNVAADAITFEKERNVLRCEGAVTIRVSGHVITARDCAIELSPGEKKLFFLSQGNLRISPATEPRYFPAERTDLIGPNSDREKLIQELRMSFEPKAEAKALRPTP